MNHTHPPIYTPEERAKMLAQMRAASGVFYSMATKIGCHPFIEFTGLMNEYIEACEDAQKQGIDFPSCNTHSGVLLPLKDYRLSYLNEKLECIFGPRVRIEPAAAETTMPPTYAEALEEVNRLVALDPAPDTENGRRLVFLAKRLEEYEKTRWPFPTEEAEPIHATGLYALRGAKD